MSIPLQMFMLVTSLFALGLGVQFVDIKGTINKAVWIFSRNYSRANTQQTIVLNGYNLLTRNQTIIDFSIRITTVTLLILSLYKTLNMQLTYSGGIFFLGLFAAIYFIYARYYLALYIGA